jgi:streptomycin 6-kinase
MLIIPERLAETCHRLPERRAWLERLPNAIHELQERWSLSLGVPFDHSDVSCAWVAPVMLADGTRAILKLGMPHFEGTHEIQGLRFWDGDPTVRLLDADVDLNAMLLEECQPGSALRELPESEQDAIVSGLLRRIWSRPAPPHVFRPLSALTAYWAAETKLSMHKWPDAGLVQEGLRLFGELSRPAADDVLLATDLHAGNVLRAERKPWLAIDPKPFVGDCAYDATQHLFNCKDRMLAAPDATIHRMGDLLEIDDERIRLWMFARSAAEPRDSWNDDSITMARLLNC